MRKSKPIHIVVHKPSDMDTFEKIYIDAAFEAIKQLAQTTPKGTGCKPEKKSKPSKTE